MCTYVVQFLSAFTDHSVPAFVFENSGQIMLTCLHSGIVGEVSHIWALILWLLAPVSCSLV